MIKDFSATLDVNVIQGEIIGIEILLSEEKVRSGDLVVASVSAYDSAEIIAWLMGRGLLIAP